jgi:hypothetical protein
MLRTCEEYSRLGLYEILSECTEMEQRLVLDMILEERQLSSVCDLLGPKMEIGSVAESVKAAVDRAHEQGREPDMSEIIASFAGSPVLTETLKNITRPEGIDVVGRMLGHANLRDNIEDETMERLQNFDMSKMMGTVAGMLSGKGVHMPDEMEGKISAEERDKMEDLCANIQGNLQSGNLDMKGLMAQLGNMTKDMKKHEILAAALITSAALPQQETGTADAKDGDEEDAENDLD